MCSKGFEPPTHGLEGRCSIQLSYEHITISIVKRVMGIEPTYPAWKAGVLPLNYTRRIGVTGFEPATSWSQTRRSSQAEPHPVSVIFKFSFCAHRRGTCSIISLTTLNVNTFFDFFLFFLFIFKKPVFLGFLAYSFKLITYFFQKKYLIHHKPYINYI